jgi:hypothetical protein
MEELDLYFMLHLDVLVPHLQLIAIKLRTELLKCYHIDNTVPYVLTELPSYGCFKVGIVPRLSNLHVESNFHDRYWQA